MYDSDFEYDYFGFKTLERSYLMRCDGEIAERPQHMIMRVAIGIHGQDVDAAIETYELMSQKYFTHATPTLFNAGLLDRSYRRAFAGDEGGQHRGHLRHAAMCLHLQKYAGGIGLSPCTTSGPRTPASAARTVPAMVSCRCLRVYNDTARYVDQGGGKRKGSFAIYLEPWHADIETFLDLKKNHGNELERAGDLFYGLWIPDLFMRRVEANEQWS